MVGFHKALFTPDNASLIVVGDTTPEAVTAALEKDLAGWKGTGKPVKHNLPDVTADSAKKGAVYLVDKPSAAQSVLTIGLVGLPRSTPDYIPLTVMNAVLGGQFSSRINLNLREDKGYTYGARSSFAFRKGAGPFSAGAPVQTAVTKEALVELVKELTDVTGPRTITDKELAFAKDRIVLGFPGKFETTAGVASTLADLVVHDLPDDYFTTYPGKVEAVTKAEVDRVAKKYLEPSKMVVLIVGDKSKVEGPIRTLEFANEVRVLDNEGNPVTTSTVPAAGKGEGR